jgi:hypothetical protein
MPVVALRISATGAVVGEAVARFDLHGVWEIATVMADVIGDAERRKTKRRKRAAPTAGLSWRRTATMIATMLPNVTAR